MAETDQVRDANTPSQASSDAPTGVVEALIEGDSPSGEGEPPTGGARAAADKVGAPIGDVEVVAALRAAVLVLARRLRYQLAGDDDLSATELAVLGRVGRCGPMTPGQLARAEHVRPPSMTKVIESLEGRGMLTRCPHPTDGRQYLVSRTEAAEAFVEASRRLRTAWLADHLAQLTPAERDAITAAVPALSRLAELP